MHPAHISFPPTWNKTPLMLRTTGSIEENSHHKQGLLYLFCKDMTAGRVVALETDTVPGLAGHAFCLSAVKRLYQLKKRSFHKPIVWLINDIQPIKPYIHISALAYKLIKAHWPGALTLIFPLTALGQRHLAPFISLHANINLASLALRQPANSFLLNALAHLKCPLATTSANLAGKPPLKQLQHIRELFGTQIPTYLERNSPMSHHASTIVDLCTTPPRISRQGQTFIKLASFSSLSPLLQ